MCELDGVSQHSLTSVQCFEVGLTQMRECGTQRLCEKQFSERSQRLDEAGSHRAHGAGQQLHRSHWIQTLLWCVFELSVRLTRSGRSLTAVNADLDPAIVQSGRRLTSVPKNIHSSCTDFSRKLKLIMLIVKENRHSVLARHLFNVFFGWKPYLSY